MKYDATQYVTNTNVDTTWTAIINAIYVLLSNSRLVSKLV